MQFAEKSNNMGFIPTANSASVYFVAADETVVLSETSAIFFDTTDIEEFSIVCDNDEVIEIVKESMLLGYNYKISNNDIVKFIFEGIVDIKSVKSIVVNGVKYAPGDATVNGEHIDNVKVLDESAGVKKEIIAKVDKDKNTVEITCTISWSDDLKDQYMDYITLDWYGMGLSTSDVCSVTHKVYENKTEYATNEETGEVEQVGTSSNWIESECKLVDSEIGLYQFIDRMKESSMHKVDGDTYDIGTYGMAIFTALYNDYYYSSELDEIDNKPLEGDYCHYDYSNESIVVKLVLDLDEYEDTYARIVADCYHYHIYKKLDYSRVVSAEISSTREGIKFNSIDYYHGVAGKEDEINSLDLMGETVRGRQEGDELVYEVVE